MIYQLKDSDIQVEVTKKRIKSFRLRIDREGHVLCSVPFLALKPAVTGFIEERRGWIIDSLNKSMESVKKSLVLNKDSVAVKMGLKQEDYINREGKKLYSAQWKKAALEAFTASLKRQEQFFISGQLPEYEIKLRKMKSIWGSCNRSRKIITMNLELLRFPVECVDYVAFHELTHFLYLHHDRQFYSYISKYMPDYKERIKLMK